MSDHFADRAAWIAALPDGDPEAAAALAHAGSCAGCARALDEGRRLLGLLDALPAPPAPSAAALDRVASRITVDLDAEGRARSPVYPAVAVLAAWAIEVALARHRAGDAGSVTVSLLGLGAAVVVAVLSGARARGATAAALLGSAALLAWVGSEPGLSPSLGMKCAAIEVGAAVLPFAVAAWSASRGRVALGAWRGAGVASAAALASQAALHLTCEASHETSHLLVFHLGGVLLAALMGLGAGRELTRRHERSVQLG